MTSKFKNHNIQAVGLLRDIFSTIDNRNGKPLSKATIENYSNKLNKLHVMVTGQPFSGDFLWLNDPDKVLGKLETTVMSSKKDYLTPVSKILKQLDAPQDLIVRYQRYMAQYKREESQLRQENLASTKDVERSLPLEDIRKLINEYSPEHTEDPGTALMFKLICVFYFESSLVPRNDLPLMRFVSDQKKAAKMSSEYNYITIDKQGVPISILMNNYKTRRIYGRQRFAVTTELRDCLLSYMRLYQKGPGDYVFSMEDGSEYGKPNFSKLVGNATLAVLGKRMNIDLIRSIIISDYYARRVHSINEDEEFARRFLHSTSVQKEYLKLNLHPNVESTGEIPEVHFDD